MKKFFNILLTAVFLTLFFSVSYAADKTACYYAAAADGPKAVSMLSPMAGRAAYFVYFDADGKYISAEPNPYLNEKGAGPLIVKHMTAKGVKVVTAGGFGGNFSSFMLASGIKVYQFTGKANDSVKAAMIKK